MRSVLVKYSRCATAAVPEVETLHDVKKTKSLFRHCTIESWQFTRCGGKTKSMDVEGVACVIRFDVIVVTRAGQGCQALLFIVQVYKQLAANRSPMFDGSCMWRNSYPCCSTALDQADKGGVAGNSCMNSFENLTLEEVGCSESTLRIGLAHGQWF